jgi:hypothetical protein
MFIPDLFTEEEFMELDEDITPLDTNNTSHMDMQGPITRARAHRLPNDVIVLRNKGEDQGVFGGRLGGGEDQIGRPSQSECPRHPEFDSASESRSSMH